MHWKDPVFEVGDIVTCIGNNGYRLTENKEYLVVKYEPSTPDENFTWPAYVYTYDDNLRLIVCHARRFIKEK